MEIKIIKNGTETKYCGGAWKGKDKKFIFKKGEKFKLETKINSFNETIYFITKDNQPFYLVNLYRKKYISEKDVKNIEAEIKFETTANIFRMGDTSKNSKSKKKILIKMYNQGGYLLISAGNNRNDGKIIVIDSEKIDQEVIRLPLPSKGGRTVPSFAEIPISEVLEKN